MVSHAYSNYLLGLLAALFPRRLYGRGILGLQAGSAVQCIWWDMEGSSLSARQLFFSPAFFHLQLGSCLP